MSTRQALVHEARQIAERLGDPRTTLEVLSNSIHVVNAPADYDERRAATQTAMALAVARSAIRSPGSEP